MKATIQGKRYDTSRCQILASRNHYNNGTYCGSTELLLASDGQLLVYRFSNGQDLYLDSFLISYDDFSEGIDYFDDLDEEQEAKCAELGLIKVVK